MRREGRANTNFEQLFPQLYTLFSGVEQDLCSEGCSRGRETQFHGTFFISILSILLSAILFVTVIRSQYQLLPLPIVATGFLNSELA